VFGGLGNLAAMLKNARELGGRMQAISDELRARRATGSAGGGLVEVEVNGLVEVLRCRIDPKLLAQPDAELLEDLVVTAVNQAVVKAKEFHAEAVRSATSGLNLPGLDDALGRMLSPQASDSLSPDSLSPDSPLPGLFPPDLLPPKTP
jgi:nucleoid-associated protein EbfC